MLNAALALFLLVGLVSGQSVTKTPSPTRSSSKSITQSIGATPSISASATPLPQGPEQVKYTDFWKYSDTGIALDSTWYTNTYDDSQWLLGRTPAGYGFTGMSTTTRYGASTSSRYITTYFRRTVMLSRVIGKPYLGSLQINVADGAVVYVNGVEVSRYNMDPAASIAFGTMATVGVTTLAAATTPFNISIPDAYWFNGNNILAVEIHKSTASSKYLYFDAQLLIECIGCASATPSKSPSGAATAQTSAQTSAQSSTPTSASPSTQPSSQPSSAPSASSSKSAPVPSQSPSSSSASNAQPSVSSNPGAASTSLAASTSAAPSNSRSTSTIPAVSSAASASVSSPVSATASTGACTCSCANIPCCGTAASAMSALCASANSNGSPAASSSSGPSTGTLIGITVGVVGAVALGVVGFIAYRRRRQPAKRNSPLKRKDGGATAQLRTPGGSANDDEMALLRPPSTPASNTPNKQVVLKPLPPHLVGRVRPLTPDQVRALQAKGVLPKSGLLSPTRTSPTHRAVSPRTSQPSPRATPDGSLLSSLEGALPPQRYVAPVPLPSPRAQSTASVQSPRKAESAATASPRSANRAPFRPVAKRAGDTMFY